MEIGIIIGILSLLIALVALLYSRNTYNKDYVEKPQEDKTALIAQFKATQTLSHQLHKDLKELMEAKNYHNEFMWPGITYTMYLQQLENSHTSSLSDELLERTISMDIPFLTIQSMMKSLEDQFNALLLMHGEVKMKLMQ